MNRIKVNVVPRSKNLTLNGVDLTVFANGEIHMNGGKKGGLNNGYLRVKVNDKFIMSHRIVYKAFNPDFEIDNSRMCIDHIDGNRANNHLSNLRLCTYQQNSCNRGAAKNNKLGHKNICRANHGKNWYWHVSIVSKGYAYNKTFSGGSGKWQDDASSNTVPKEVIKYRDKMLQELHGEFALVTTRK